MQLEALRILHLPKKRIQYLDPALKSLSDSFHLETCQRWIWISNSEKVVQPFLTQVGAEVYRGRDAYLFLLKLATGLESEVLGETDVFGQIKMAWRKTEFAKDSFSSDLAPWIKRIFEDTKEIRTRFLQNLGGASYGSLVRKLLKNQVGSSDGPVLLVGAGQIARSIAPFLMDSELWIWNRASVRLSTFHRELLNRPRAQVRKLATPEEEIEGWEKAAHIVMCIPLDSVQDTQRMSWFQQGGSSNRTIIHLGGMREQCDTWGTVPRFYCLNDLFSLQSSLGNVRSVQVAQAQRACEERSKLRGLGASLSICHGWEDLACFA